MTITPEEIARLRASHARISGASVGSGAAIYVLDEVPRLLDEIERLRADLREALALLRDVDEFATPGSSWQRRDALLAKHKGDA